MVLGLRQHVDTLQFSFQDGDNAVFEGEAEWFMETTGKTGKHRADMCLLCCTDKTYWVRTPSELILSLCNLSVSPFEPIADLNLPATKPNAYKSYRLLNLSLVYKSISNLDQFGHKT